MTVPASGSLSLGRIRQELQNGNYSGGPYTSAATGLDTAENGGYATINTCSTLRPSATNPASMSEWYGYNHLASCGPSAYAYSDGGSSISQNMLYANSLNWETRVSSSRPSINSQFSISFWIKRASADSSQGYILGWNAPSGDYIMINWVAMEDPNNPGTFLNYMYLNADAAAGGFLSSGVNFSDSNNAFITGVSDTLEWSPANQGNVGSHGYSLITVVVNNTYFGTSDYVKWYWNGTQLDVPWQTGGSGQSNTDADSPATANWLNTDFFVGGYVPSELSAGCQLDGVAIYPTAALSSSHVNDFYNNGSMVGLSAYINPTDEFVFYNFESASPNLGTDSHTYYQMHLDEFGSPIRVADPAV